MPSRTRWMIITMVAAIPGIVLAEDMTDATKILEKVDAAAKAVTTVTYEVSFKGTGAAESRMPKLEGTYSLEGWNDQMPKRFFIDIQVTRPGSSESEHIVGGGNGEEYFLIDHKNKKAYQDMDSGVMGSASRVMFGGLMAEYVHASPFSDELKGDKRELQGSEPISGEDCYKIHVIYSGGRGEATWWFSKKDFLPRARLDTGQDGQDAGRLKTVTKLVIDPKFTDDVFKLKLPEGYEQVDDFAP